MIVIEAARYCQMNPRTAQAVLLRLRYSDDPLFQRILSQKLDTTESIALRLRERFSAPKQKV